MRGSTAVTLDNIRVACGRVWFFCMVAFGGIACGDDEAECGAGMRYDDVRKVCYQLCPAGSFDPDGKHERCRADCPPGFEYVPELRECSLKCARGSLDPEVIERNCGDGSIDGDGGV